MGQFKPKVSKPLQTMKLKTLNHKKAFGGPKPLPKFKNLRTVKGIKRAIGIIRTIKRDF